MLAGICDVQSDGQIQFMSNPISAPHEGGLVNRNPDNFCLHAAKRYG